MDRWVLKKLGLEEETRLKSQDIFGLVNPKVKGNPDISDISDICGECEWRGICSYSHGVALTTHPHPTPASERIRLSFQRSTKNH